MATKKTTKTTKATKGKKSEPTFNGFAAMLNAPFKKGRSQAEKDAAQQRAKAKAEKAKREPKPKKPSLLDAAATYLVLVGEPMSCKAIVEELAERGLWSSPAGKTPHATLYAAILREIATKGKDARFKKTDRGQFAAA